MHPNHPLKRVHHTTVILGMILSLGIALFGLAYAALILIPNLMVRDEVVPDTSDLDLKTVTVATEQNAYIPMMAAVNAANLSDTEIELIRNIADEKKWSDPAADGLVTKYATAITALETAAAATYLENPDYMSSTAAESTYNLLFSPWDETVYQTGGRYITDPAVLKKWAETSNLSSLIRLMDIKARRLAVTDQTAGLNEALTIAILGQKLANTRQTIIGHLVYARSLTEGLTAVRDIAAASTIPSADIAAITRLLPDGDIAIGTQAAQQMEYFMTIRHMPPTRYIMSYGSMISANVSLFTRGVWWLSWVTRQTNFAYLPNQTQRLFADIVRTQLTELAQPCISIKMKPDTSGGYNQDQVARRALITPNAVGKILTTDNIYNISGLSQRTCNTKAAAALTQAAIAARSYERDTGALPTELSALVPTYLSAIPTDPYTNQPISYDRVRRVVFSAGAKKSPVAGNPADTITTADVPTMSIAAATP